VIHTDTDIPSAKKEPRVLPVKNGPVAQLRHSLSNLSSHSSAFRNAAPR